MLRNPDAASIQAPHSEEQSGFWDYIKQVASVFTLNRRFMAAVFYTAIASYKLFKNKTADQVSKDTDYTLLLSILTTVPAYAFGSILQGASLAASLKDNLNSFMKLNLPITATLEKFVYGLAFFGDILELSSTGFSKQPSGKIINTLLSAVSALSLVLFDIAHKHPESSIAVKLKNIFGESFYKFAGSAHRAMEQGEQSAIYTQVINSMTNYLSHISWVTLPIVALWGVLEYAVHKSGSEVLKQLREALAKFNEVVSSTILGFVFLNDVDAIMTGADNISGSAATLIPAFTAAEGTIRTADAIAEAKPEEQSWFEWGKSFFSCCGSSDSSSESELFEPQQSWGDWACSGFGLFERCRKGRSSSSSAEARTLVKPDTRTFGTV